MRRRTIRAWAFVHKWSSIVCTAFLLMLCVTGLPLIFHDEIDDATGTHVALPTLPGRASLSLDTLLARALANRPGEVPLYMSFDSDRPVVNVTTGVAPDVATAAMHFSSLDQRTGAILPAVPPGGVMDFVLRLHTDLLLGFGGMLFLGAMGLLFLLAIASGVVLYAPLMARRRFGEVRHDRNRRIRWLDLHNLFGIVTVMWASVVGLTGVINTLVDPATDYWKSDQLAQMKQVVSTAKPGPNTRHLSVQAALASAVAAAPGMRPQFIAFPGVAYSTDRHLAVFLQGRSLATRRVLTPALIDVQTGRLDAIRPMPWYMQALLLSQPLHFGDYAGLPLKVIWAVFDLITIAVLVSGLYLWLGRRRG